jgi:hypothetical protein
MHALIYANISTRKLYLRVYTFLALFDGIGFNDYAHSTGWSNMARKMQTSYHLLGGKQDYQIYITHIFRAPFSNKHSVMSHFIIVNPHFAYTTGLIWIFDV